MTVQLHHGDCLEVVSAMPSSSVDLILTDPPYFKVKGEPWDNQWRKPAQFLSWMDRVIEQFARVLKPSGSLYLFAGHRMAARVECLVAERLRVLNHIVWVKPDAAGAEKGARGGLTRAFVPQTERLIFAAHANPLGDALRAAMKQSGLTALDVNRIAFQRETGLISLWLCDREAHGACEPSREDWIKAMRACGIAASSRDYDALARPFMARGLLSDAWEFQPVRSYPGKHPCEKPSSMLEQVIETSSRPGDLVLDGFMGTGSTGIAAVKLGRRFTGCDKAEHHCADAARRIAAACEEYRRAA